MVAVASCTHSATRDGLWAPRNTGWVLWCCCTPELHKQVHDDNVMMTGLCGVVLQDGQSFLHVNYYAAAGVSWQSVGLLLADSLGDARSTAATAGLNAAPSNRSSNSISGSRMESSNSTSLRGRLLYAAPSTSTVPAGAAAGNSVRGRPQYNYVLAADNRNLAQHMQRLGAQDTPTPCLLYVDSNITFSKPPVPAAGIPVARPLVLVGLVGWNTSIDFHMQVGVLVL